MLKKYPKISNPRIIVIGCNFVVLLNINGCNKLPSSNWITAITTSVNIPIVVLWVKPTITAGIPPKYGPK